MPKLTLFFAKQNCANCFLRPAPLCPRPFTSHPQTIESYDVVTNAPVTCAGFLPSAADPYTFTSKGLRPYVIGAEM
jgi:hypothetical protein